MSLLLNVTLRAAPDVNAEEAHTKGYIEEWQEPPHPRSGDVAMGAHREKQARWVSYLLWWPIQMVLRHCKLHITSQSFVWLADMARPSYSPIALPAAHCAYLHLVPSCHYHGRISPPAIL